MSRLLSTVSAITFVAGSYANADVPKVVADIAPIHSLVSRVMDGVGEPKLIVSNETSPHDYRLRPADAEAIEDANLVFWMGEGLTPWMERALEALSNDTDIVEFLALEESTLLSFREGALFEAHDHSDHDDHDDHAKKDDHDDHDDHGHGSKHHAFEWAGLFELSPGTYSWSFTKVDGNYADPAMKMVILETTDIEAAEEGAEELLEADSGTMKENSDNLVAANTAYVLNFDPAKDTTVFAVNITTAGKYAFFTEHMPFEFEADEHFFKDASGSDVEPIAQEPEGGHHDHGHGDHAGHDDHDDHDDHAGHDHGAFDPHAWLSTNNAKTWLNVIAARLSSIDPDNAGAYFANASEARGEMDALDVEINAMLDPVRGGKFVVFHDAYQYFETVYDFPASGAISLGDASDPSAARVAEIANRIKSENIACVLSEPQFNAGLVKTVMGGTDATTEVIDPLGFGIVPGSSLYPKLIRAMAQSLVNCLK